jgi:DNA-directed RNA polymerase subunit K/omega
MADNDEGNGADMVEFEEDFEIDEGALEQSGKRQQEKKDLGNELLKFHPEARIDTVESTAMDTLLTNVPPTFANADGQVDTKHRSVPYLTQYERTKILGMRTNQLSQGARPYIAVPKHITILRDIARLELEARRLPIIVKRPMPDGTFEKWKLSDLLLL